MIRLEHTEVYGWQAAIRGMRNPFNSWGKSDSCFRGIDDRGNCDYCLEPCEENPCYEDGYYIGKNDLELMRKLAKGGSVHAKYRRMITVTVDITAPLYWWKELDAYKVGTVASSCSTMHKLTAKPFEVDDFSHGRLCDASMVCLEQVVQQLNYWRGMYLEHDEKWMWWQMIQLLPSSYNQKRTVQLNYEVLVGMYRDRRNHKLDEWRAFCKWIEGLPHSELIT